MYKLFASVDQGTACDHFLFANVGQGTVCDQCLQARHVTAPHRGKGGVIKALFVITIYLHDLHVLTPSHGSTTLSTAWPPALIIAAQSRRL